MNGRADVQASTRADGAAPRLDACAVRVVNPGRVAAALRRMPAEADLAGAVEIFALLADPGRLRLLVALLDAEMCVCDLAATAGLSESAASHALRLLRAHRVVAVRRSGRMAYYRLADSHVRMLIEVTLAHAAHDGGEAGRSAAREGGRL